MRFLRILGFVPPIGGGAQNSNTWKSFGCGGRLAGDCIDSEDQKHRGFSPIEDRDIPDRLSCTRRQNRPAA
jgi:hypothetical protein